MSPRPQSHRTEPTRTEKEIRQVTPPTRTRQPLALAFALACLAALLAASPATAAPQLEVTISHHPTTMPRNDEALNYVLGVKNNAPVWDGSAALGDALTCQPGSWFPGPASGVAPVLSYEWRRNGAAIPGATESTYVAAAADEGMAIQCVVIGTNEKAKTKFASLNPVVVAPVPAVAVPKADDPKNNESRPTIAGTGVANRVCTPPANWKPRAPESPVATYAFQWLRNSEPIPGATGNEYLPTAEDTGKILQCEVIGETAGGKTVGISNNSPVGTVSQPPNNGVAQTPSIADPNQTTGPIAVELELPEGEETGAYQIVDPGTQAPPIGWTCVSTEPAPGVRAKVVCTRSDILNPQASFPGIEVRTSIGADALDPSFALVSVTGGGSATDSAEDEFHFSAPVPFGIESFAAKAVDPLGNDFTQAGGHPFSASTSLALRTRIGRNGKRAPIEFPKGIKFDLPPGFTGNPEAAPQTCASVNDVFNDAFASPSCPRASIVGSVDVDTSATGFVPGVAIYAIEPEDGVPAQFAFALRGAQALVVLTPRLRPSEGYAVSIDAPALAKTPVFFSADATLCGYGADVQVHPDGQMLGAPQVTSCKQAGEVGANPRPLLTNPTRCDGSEETTVASVDSWDNPGAYDTASAKSPPLTGCGSVPFSPSTGFVPTSHQADSPTGLDVSIEVPTDGLESPTGVAQGFLKKAVVTLPKGMAVNPAAADGLGACTSAEIGLGNNDPVQCPASSKVGSAEIETPILDDTLTGAVYLAKQGDNPFKSLLALYLVAESKQRGVIVKLAGKVEAQPDGQLVTTFDDNPQAPVSSVRLHLNAGNRAPLIAPPKCGSYQIRSELTPWSSAEAIVSVSSFEVTSGPNGSPCPAPSLSPKLRSGVQNPVAGSSSPFVTQLSREDGSERFSSLSLRLPPGLIGHLKGIPYCSDATLAGIPTAEGTGQSQIDNPSCPAASQVGTVSVGAGAGSSPFYVHTARAYLAGPYKGAPLSIAVVAPAVAGPFDLGNVVVRNATWVDPVTTQVTVVSDPIPTILHGIPLDIRDIRVNVDRNGFILSPTSCAQMSVDAAVGGELGSSAFASDRFQVGDCAALGFKPRLSLKLKGSTKRSGNPALTARIAFPKGGYANIRRASVALPRSEFLDQSHIRTICTRVQFAADACPKGSIYGRAEATSPLLDYKLVGKVYLRSSSNPLPDLVIALRGPANQPIAVDIAGRIDSVRGGIRTTFASVPDAPVSSFVLKMQGGKKGLLENSRNLCRTVNRATAKMDGHNGKVYDSRPKLRAQCGKGKKQAKARKGRGGR